MSRESVHHKSALELIAREVAAGLSLNGDDDRRGYVSLARQIETRLGWQPPPLMVHDRGGDPIA